MQYYSQANVSIEDSKGWQPIDYACKFRHINLAELYVDLIEL